MSATTMNAAGASSTSTPAGTREDLLTAGERLYLYNIDDNQPDQFQTEESVSPKTTRKARKPLTEKPVKAVPTGERTSKRLTGGMAADGVGAGSGKTREDQFKEAAALAKQSVIQAADSAPVTGSAVKAPAPIESAGSNIPAALLNTNSAAEMPAKQHTDQKNDGDDAVAGGSEVTGTSKRSCTSSKKPEGASLAVPWKCGNRLCCTGQTWFDREQSGRKNISQFLGRNKKATKTIHEDVWHITCRKDYQHGVYDPGNENNHSRVPAWQITMLQIQMKRLQIWRPDALFTIQLTKSMTLLVSLWETELRHAKNDVQKAREAYDKKISLAKSKKDKKSEKVNVEQPAVDMKGKPKAIKKKIPMPEPETVFPVELADDFVNEYCGENKDYNDIIVLLANTQSMLDNKTLTWMPPVEFLINEMQPNETVTAAGENYDRWVALEDGKQYTGPPPLVNAGPFGQFSDEYGKDEAPSSDDSNDTSSNKDAGPSAVAPRATASKRSDANSKPTFTRSHGTRKRPFNDLDNLDRSGSPYAIDATRKKKRTASRAHVEQIEEEPHTGRQRTPNGRSTRKRTRDDTDDIDSGVRRKKSYTRLHNEPRVPDGFGDPYVFADRGQSSGLLWPYGAFDDSQDIVADPERYKIFKQKTEDDRKACSDNIVKSPTSKNNLGRTDRPSAAQELATVSLLHVGGTTRKRRADIIDNTSIDTSPAHIPHKRLRTRQNLSTIPQVDTNVNTDLDDANTAPPASQPTNPNPLKAFVPALNNILQPTATGSRPTRSDAEGLRLFDILHAASNAVDREDHQREAQSKAGE